MVMVDGKIVDGDQMHLCLTWFEGLTEALVQCAYIDQWRGPGLCSKLLDAAIGPVFAPYCPGGHQGCRQNNNDGTIRAVCWPFRWPWQCTDTVPRTSPDRWGPGLLREPLVAATGRVLRPIVSIGHAKADFSDFFIVHVKCPFCSGLFCCLRRRTDPLCSAAEQTRFLLLLYGIDFY